MIVGVPGARIIVPGNPANQDCRTSVCRRNENTDLTRWMGAGYLIHRTASSQALGPTAPCASRLAEQRHQR